MNIQKYLDLFEFKKDDKSESPRFREGFYCFKDAVYLTPKGTDEPKYRAMSDLINESGLDQDSAYTFTVQALEAIDELQATFKSDFRPPKGTLLKDYLREGEIIEPFSEAPIYNSEVMEWASKGTNYAYVDEMVEEMGSDIFDPEKGRGIIWLLQYAYSRAWEEHYYKVLEAVKA